MGPRPEVRHYVDFWTPERMHVLDVRPGITEPASIKFRNENELMEKRENSCIRTRNLDIVII